MRSSLLILYVFIFSCCCRAQTNEMETDSAEFLQLVYANRDLTYFTLSQGIGNLPHMITEGRFSGSYFMKKQQINWALELNLNMTLRILDKSSFPIPPPSYNPELTFYHEINGGAGSGIGKLLFDHAYWDLSIGHHSNGRPGDFYKKDSLGRETNTIDLQNASFSLQYLEWGFSTFDHRVSRGQKDFYTNLRLAFRWYPALLATSELKDNYGLYRLFATYNLFRFPWSGYSDFFLRSRLKVHAGWMFGDMAEAKSEDVGKRLTSEITWYYYPDWLADLGFFAQYFHGQDYYNVQFHRTVSVFRIGVCSNPLNFTGFRKFIK